VITIQGTLKSVYTFIHPACYELAKRSHSTSVTK
jgi:hypothetical protein